MRLTWIKKKLGQVVRGTKWFATVLLEIISFAFLAIFAALVLSLIEATIADLICFGFIYIAVRVDHYRMKSCEYDMEEEMPQIILLSSLTFVGFIIKQALGA